MLINSKVIEIIFAVFILANNFYTTYNIIYTDCHSIIYNVAILSIVNNMITFSLVLLFIARDIQNRYYDILFAIFMMLSCCGSGLIIMVIVNSYVHGSINECDRTFFYIVMANMISSIIPVVLFILYFVGLVLFYIPYDVIKRQYNKKNVERYVQTDPEMIGLMDNQSGKTFVFPPDELYDFDAVEI